MAIKAALPGLMEEYKATKVAGSIVLFSTVAVQQVCAPGSKVPGYGVNLC